MEPVRAIAILCQIHSLVEKNDAITQLINRIEDSVPPLSNTEILATTREGFRYLELSKLTGEQQCHFCDLARSIHDEFTGQNTVCSMDCPHFLTRGANDLSPGETYYIL